MVKSNSKRKIEVRLILNEEEATYLRDFIQNARFDQEGNVIHESPKERRIRFDIFETLNKDLGGNASASAPKTTGRPEGNIMPPRAVKKRPTKFPFPRD